MSRWQYFWGKCHFSRVLLLTREKLRLYGRSALIAEELRPNWKAFLEGEIEDGRNLFQYFDIADPMPRFRAQPDIHPFDTIRGIGELFRVTVI